MIQISRLRQAIKARTYINTPRTVEHLKSKTIWSDGFTPEKTYLPSFPKNYQGPFGTPMKVSDPPDLPSYQEALMQENVFSSGAIERIVNELVNVPVLYVNRVHQGHDAERRHPQMNKFIFGDRFGMDIIDLDQTCARLKAAMNVIGNSAFRKAKICFICENPRFRYDVDALASDLGQFTIESMTEDVVTRFDRAFETGEKMPDIFVFFGTGNATATGMSYFVDLANKVHACSIGFVDTDCNPSAMTYRIPANDDSPVAMRFYMNLCSDIIKYGYKLRQDMEDQATTAEEKEAAARAKAAAPKATHAPHAGSLGNVQRSKSRKSNKKSR